MARIILYTGKGGVGKTSVAAATALRCADLGYRTMVLSTDAAHSLGDSFDSPLGSTPTEIAPHLWGQEVDVLHQMDEYWGTVQEYLSGLLVWRGADGLVAQEASVLPGMEELASLLQITHLHDSGDYDVIIIDCAPTGETLKFLSFPEAARWYLSQIFPVQRRVAQLAGPLIRAMTDIPTPDDRVFDSIHELLIQLDRMHELLADPERSSVRIVLNPEKMVVKEAQRSYTYLSLYGFPTDAIVSNRILPSFVTDAYLQGWKDMQEKYGQLVEQAFSPLPIYKVPLFDHEMVGPPMLRRMAEAIYGETDPTQIMYRGQPQSIVPANGGYDLQLRLPLVDRSTVDLGRFGDELVIDIGNFRRNLILPRTLAGLDVSKATFDGDTLIIHFAAPTSPT
ncbi:MAG: ArsA family ATPase [Anaerolineae bacterium]|nr:ArsA family ATPase [Anaerolineae bacterium]